MSQTASEYPTTICASTTTRTVQLDRRHLGRRDEDLAGLLQIRIAKAFVDIERVTDPNLPLNEMFDQLAATLQTLMHASVCIAALDDANCLKLTAATDEKIGILGETQVAQRDGPLWWAFSTSSSYKQLDASICAQRWPTIIPIAIALGFRSISAIPILGDDQSVGVVCLADERHVTSDHRDALLTLLIAGAGVALANRRSSAAATKLVGQLQMALETRIVIEQAKGFIQARMHCSIDEAFEQLRGYARSHNRKLDAVAKEVLNQEIPLLELARRSTVPMITPMRLHQ